MQNHKYEVKGKLMEKQFLVNHSHYFYTHSDFFNYSGDLVHAFLMKDYEIGMHEQEFFEINIVTKGEGIHYINNSRIGASMGDVFIIPPRISHGYVGGQGFDVFHVILNDSFMNKYTADLQLLPHFFTLFGAEPMMRAQTSSPLHLTLIPRELDKTLVLLREIERYNKYDDPIQCLMRSSFAMATIGLLCSAYAIESPQSGTTSGEDLALMKSISFIHERYYEKITIDDLTRIAHISRSLYIKKFKEICKMTPAAYINKIRIESASDMLHSTKLSVAEIAERTGFYDASHFSKSFESYYGISPVAYRSSKTEKYNND